MLCDAAGRPPCAWPDNPARGRLDCQPDTGDGVPRPRARRRGRRPGDTRDDSVGLPPPSPPSSPPMTPRRRRSAAARGRRLAGERESGSCACLAAICWLAAWILSDRPGSSACWPQRGRSRGSQEGAALASLKSTCLLLASCRTDRAAALAGRSGLGVAGVRELCLPRCNLRACCFGLVGQTGQQRLLAAAG